VQSQARLDYAEAQPALARKGNIRLFLTEGQEKSACFLSPSDDGGGDGDRHEETNIFYNNFNSIQKTMKRKDYQKPTMQVVKLQHQAHLLQASVSGQVNATMDSTWEEENL